MHACMHCKNRRVSLAVFFFLSITIIISVYTSIQGIYMNSLRLTIEHVILE